jgi:hypothetical protein
VHAPVWLDISQAGKLCCPCLCYSGFSHKSHLILFALCLPIYFESDQSSAQLSSAQLGILAPPTSNLEYSRVWCFVSALCYLQERRPIFLEICPWLWNIRKSSLWMEGSNLLVTSSWSVALCFPNHIGDYTRATFNFDVGRNCAIQCYCELSSQKLCTSALPNSLVPNVHVSTWCANLSLKYYVFGGGCSRLVFGFVGDEVLTKSWELTT